MGDSDPFAEGALLIIDVINDFAFPGGDELVRQMDPVVEAIDALRRRAGALQRPVIHVNDNFGRWRSNFQQVIEWCRREGARGAGIAERLSPRESDYFVLKPGQSGFYQTPLPALLEYLKVSKLVLTGVAGDQCVMTTAMDAHIRDYHLWVPANATASMTPKRNQPRWITSARRWAAASRQ
jgi:nicotinamidase-related amidase